VLDSLNAGPVLVLAHSLGAAIAFRLAIDRPDLVRGIVSLEGGPTEEATTPTFPQRHALPAVGQAARRDQSRAAQDSRNAARLFGRPILGDGRHRVGLHLGEARDFDANTQDRSPEESSSIPRILRRTR